MTGPSELDGLRVNHGALDHAAEQMKATVDRIDNRLNQLEGELAPLASQWSGHQRNAYYEAKHQWDWAIQEMKHLLDRSHATVYDSNDQYRAVDLRGAGRFGG